MKRLVLMIATAALLFTSIPHLGRLLGPSTNGSPKINRFHRR